jgi:hypothetical protein
MLATQVCLLLCAAAIFFVTRAFGFFVSVDRLVRIDPPPRKRQEHQCQGQVAYRGGAET